LTSGRTRQPPGASGSGSAARIRPDARSSRITARPKDAAADPAAETEPDARVASEIGDIARFPTPRQLVGYTGLCPRVYQSGNSDRRGPLAKNGPRYLRWALIEATAHACKHPHYRDRYQRTKTRLGKQRGAKVAQVDLARRLADAIWHMLTRDQPFAPAGATDPLAA